ncbi:MAG: phospholipase D-like domain-containing protein [Deltaproteobacteria bacterium]|nr:phospholipase D-like domain-containing protein [Deltaproteobacteria bacterium]
MTQAPVEPQISEELPDETLSLIELLRDGSQAFPAWLDAIAKAEREVLLEMYWFDSDTIGQRFASALIERARAGVEVRLIYDAIGCLGVDRAMFAAMRAAGAEVIEFHPIHPWAKRFSIAKAELRDHRKILVVDGHVGFVGGINICDHNLPVAEGGQGWRDDAVCIRGAALTELRALFFDSWARAGGSPPARGGLTGWRIRRALDVAAEAQTGEPIGTFSLALDGVLDVIHAAASREQRDALRAQREHLPLPRKQAALAPNAGTVQIVGHASWGSIRTLRNLYVRRINRAKKHILIANSYFAPDLRVRAALVRAARRGVEVRVLVPHKSDVPAVAWAARASYARLLRAGVHIHEWTSSMLHCKSAVIDGWATVGSYNFDYRSLRYNLEVNAVTELTHFVRTLEASIRADLQASNPVLYDQWKLRPWWHRIVEQFFYLFRKIL